MSPNDRGLAPHRRVAVFAGAAAITISVLSTTTVTPSDPGTPARCGTLLAGGFTSMHYACEQTRGVYRAVVGLGVSLGVALMVAAFVRSRWGLWLALAVIASMTVIAALLAGTVMFGDHLTSRWIAIFPAGVAVSGGVGLAVLSPRLRRSGSREPHLDPSVG